MGRGKFMTLEQEKAKVQKEKLIEEIFMNQTKEPLYYLHDLKKMTLKQLLKIKSQIS